MVNNMGNSSETARDESFQQGLPLFVDIISQLERMHRLLLDVIKDEFLRLRIIEINPVQGLLIYNIGANEYSAGELRQRGYYQGSNVSYNLKKLVETGYMSYYKSEVDKRSVRIALTEKGKEIHDIIENLFEQQFQDIMKTGTWSLSDCKQTRDLLLLLENYWGKCIRFVY